jgi:hypothetical protein
VCECVCVRPLNPPLEGLSKEPSLNTLEPGPCRAGNDVEIMRDEVHLQIEGFYNV